MRILSGLLQDLRYALRTIEQKPPLHRRLRCNLTLGIGANTAIFSAINAIFSGLHPTLNPHRL